MISVQGLTKEYGLVKAVDNISFDMRKGEILGFLGPNGAGKTTTMKILTGYVTPTFGSVKIKDMQVSAHPMEVKRLIGYMPQSFPLYDDMMVIDYLQFIAQMREIPASKLRGALSQAVEVCGLEDVLGRSIFELSHGYQQRVGLAQALIHDPEILILDEPTSGLDPNQIRGIRNLIKRIGEEKTVILSTHILPEVTATCNRVVIINEGKLVADGTPDELTAREQGAARITLTLDKPYEDAAKILGSVDFVKNVKELGGAPEARYLVEAQKGQDIRARVFQCAVANQWVVLEMSVEQVSLEDIFQKLTQSDVDRSAA